MSQLWTDHRSRPQWQSEYLRRSVSSRGTTRPRHSRSPWRGSHGESSQCRQKTDFEYRIFRVSRGFCLAICQEIWYHDYAFVQGNTSLEAHLFTWGCRVSTGEQVEELQVEVSVCTLVKQPTNNRCQTGIQLRSRCLRNSKRRPPNFLLWGWCWASKT